MSFLSVAIPELSIALSGLVLLLAGLFKSRKTVDVVTGLAVTALVVVAFVTAQGEGASIAFHEMFITDDFRRIAKVIVLLAAAGSLLLAPSFWAKTGQSKAEYPVLVMFASLGMMLMISAHDLMAFYVGLELQNLSLYILVSFDRDRPASSEAGLKYFTLSALSSCVLLFGLSFVYGLTGATSFGGIGAALAAPDSMSAGLALGIAFVIAGLAFKIAAAPFHMWAPDVYEGAATPVTAFLSGAPKVAAFSLLIGFLAGPVLSLQSVWQPVIAALAVISMGVGALAGLWQTNLKRMMAYSAVVNAGTILIGFMALGIRGQGVAAILIYLVMYVFGTLGVLGGVSLLYRNTHPIEQIDDLAGLSKSHPVVALLMALSLFSLAGVPPLAGFFGKYFILLAAVQADWIGLVFVGVLTSVIAAAYYLRVIKVMYFDPAKKTVLDPVPVGAPLLLVGIVVVFLSFFVFNPSPLVHAIQSATEGLMTP